MKTLSNQKFRVLILISICLILLIACTVDNTGWEESGSTKGISGAEQVESGSVNGPENAETTLVQPAIDIIEEGNSVGEGNIPKEKDAAHENNIDRDMEEYITYFEEKYADVIPNSWGERVEGVVTEIDTDDRVIALTFDACGGKSDGYDENYRILISQDCYPVC